MRQEVNKSKREEINGLLAKLHLLTGTSLAEQSLTSMLSDVVKAPLIKLDSQVCTVRKLNTNKLLLVKNQNKVNLLVLVLDNGTKCTIYVCCCHTA